jgi:hypothetical protein
VWVAAIAPFSPRAIGDQMGKATANGFVMEQLSIEVFEKK